MSAAFQSAIMATMPALLVCPIAPRLAAGNGLAHRAAVWALALGHDVRVAVVPVSGAALDSPWPTTVIGLPDNTTRLNAGIEMLGRPAWSRFATAVGPLPIAAGIAPMWLGERSTALLRDIDVIVCFRSYLLPFVLGLVERSNLSVVCDLDDDDEQFERDTGWPMEAAAYARLISYAGPRIATFTHSTIDPPISAAECRMGPTWVPNAVDVPDVSGRRPTEGNLAIVANFTYGPNIEGLRWFLQDVWPLISGARLHVVGPGSELLGEELPHVTFCGYVADLRAMYSMSAVALVPLLSGSGTRIKAIEAMVHGLAVVGTSKGFEGINAQPGVHALIADDHREFAAHVGRLLNDSAAAAELGRRGREFVKEHFSLPLVTARMAGLVDSTSAWPGQDR